MDNFSARLKELRSASHYTQKQIADAVSLSTRQIIRYEQGLQEPTISIAISLADFFDVSLDYLCGRSEEK